MALNPGQVLATTENGAVSAFYSQAYALVRFLREEGYGKRLVDYQRLLLGGLNGDWPLSEDFKKIAADRNIPMRVRWNRAMGLQLFNYYFCDDTDLATIEKEYFAFCRKIVYHVKLR